MKNLLIFEGAGWAGGDNSLASDLRNARIRTKFKNNKGRHIYLEIGRHYEGYPIVMDAFYCSYDCNDKESYIHGIQRNGYIGKELAKADVLEWVNKTLDCSFTDIYVSNERGGYRVFSNNWKYGDGQISKYIDMAESGYIPVKGLKYIRVEGYATRNGGADRFLDSFEVTETNKQAVECALVDRGYTDIKRFNYTIEKTYED